jgi:hypothetical protein
MNEKDIKKILALVPGARRAADGVIVGGERGRFHITGMHEQDEDLTPEENLFSPFCAKKEIIRLREIKSPQNYPASPSSHRRRGLAACQPRDVGTP